MWPVWVYGLVCVTLARQVMAQTNKFFSPPGPGPTKDYTNIPTYYIGHILHMEWRTNYTSSYLRLWQDYQSQTDNMFPAATVLKDDLQGQDLFWTVSYGSLDPKDAQVYFLEIRDKVNGEESFTSGYFYIKADNSTPPPGGSDGDGSGGNNGEDGPDTVTQPSTGKDSGNDSTQGSGKDTNGDSKNGSNDDSGKDSDSGSDKDTDADTGKNPDGNSSTSKASGGDSDEGDSEKKPGENSGTSTREGTDAAPNEEKSSREGGKTAQDESDRKGEQTDESSTGDGSGGLSSDSGNDDSDPDKGGNGDDGERASKSTKEAGPAGSGTLTPAQTAGIAVGCTVAAFLALAVGWGWLRKRRRRASEGQMARSPSTTSASKTAGAMSATYHEMAGRRSAAEIGGNGRTEMAEPRPGYRGGAEVSELDGRAVPAELDSGPPRW